MAQKTFEEIFEKKLAELRGLQAPEGESLETALEIPSFVRTDYFVNNERTYEVPYDRVLYIDYIENEAAQTRFRSVLLNLEASDAAVADAALDCGLGVNGVKVVFSNFFNLLYKNVMGVLSHEQMQEYLRSYFEKISCGRVQHLKLKCDARTSAFYSYDIARSSLELTVPNSTIKFQAGNLLVVMGHVQARVWSNEVLNGDLGASMDPLQVLALIFPNHQLNQMRAAIKEDPARFESMSSEQLWLTLMRPQKLEMVQAETVEASDLSEGDLVNWDQFPRVREGLRQAVFKILAQKGEVQVTPLHPEPEVIHMLCVIQQDELRRYNNSGLWTRISKPDPRAPYWSLKVPEPVMVLHRTMWDLVREQRYAADLERCAVGREDWKERALLHRANAAAWGEFLPVAVADTEFALTREENGGSYTPDWVARQALISSELDTPMQIGVSEIRAAIMDANERHGAAQEVLALVKSGS